MSDSLNGSTQSGRGRDALAPERAPVDARTPPQMLHFVAEFARILRYIAPDGTADGNWYAFFSNDLSFLLAKILCFDANHELAEVTRIVHAEAVPHYRDRKILKRIVSLYQQVSNWVLQARDIGVMNPLGTPAEWTLQALIDEQLAPLYQSVLTACKSNPKHYGAVWQEQENKYLHQLSGAAHNFLTQLWNTPAGSDSSDFTDTLELSATHLSFVQRIAAILPPMQDYFNSASHETLGHQPHTALMAAFLNIFKHAQDDANAFTARHLEFYYRSVLQLHERPAQADKAFVCFQPTPGSAVSLVPAGTPLRAGKLPDGQDLIYQVDDELAVTQDILLALKTIHAAPAAQAASAGPRMARLYAAPKADAQDGVGAPLSNPALGWPTFGRDWKHRPDAADSAPPAEVGLIITAPILLLRGGRRFLRVRFQYAAEATAMTRSPLGVPGDAPRNAAPASQRFEDVVDGYLQAVAESYPELSNPAAAQQAMREACTVWVTTPTGWMPVEKISLSANRKQAWIEMVLLLPATFPAMAPGPAAPLEAGGGSPWPRLKLILAPQARLYPYSFIQQLSLSGISLRVAVTGLIPSGISNNLGQLNPASPFPPFGTAPILGSYLQLDDPELYSKPIVRAALHLDWFNLPQAPQDLAQYYQGYGPPQIANDSFRASFQVRRQDRWTVLGNPSRPLFTAPGVNLPAGAKLSKSLSFALSDGVRAGQSWQAIRMELVAPVGAFGHESYPQLLATSAMKAASALSSAALLAAVGQKVSYLSFFKKLALPKLPLPKPSLPKAVLPKPEVVLPVAPKAPFVPIAAQVSLSYVAGSSLQAVEVQADGVTKSACYYQLGPFGYLAAPPSGYTLLDGISRSGQLYLGLQQLTPGHQVSLLFGMRETALQQRVVRRGWPTQSTAATAVRSVDWYYLSNNQWLRFRARDLQDGTANLTKTGIVRLQTTEHSMDDRNTILPAGLFWLAAVVDDPETHSHTIYAATQAASATQKLNGAQASAAGPLPAGTIKDFVKKPAGIQGVSQMLPTLGGLAAERAEAFRVRVSERLRHKQRALTPVDFEQLALDMFPEVLQAKCITRAASNPQTYVSPTLPYGRVGLVVVPRPPQHARHPARPALPASSLQQIQAALLKKSAASFGDLLVFNPQYEELKVCVQVEFKADHDVAYYQRVLNDAISAWIAPWRTDSTVPLAIGGGSANMNDLYVYIAACPGVQHVDALYALLVYRNGSRRDTRWLMRDAVLMPSSPWSVLMPAENHYITTSTDRYGIDTMVIGKDLIVFQDAPPPDGASPVLQQAATDFYTLRLPLATLATNPARFKSADGE